MEMQKNVWSMVEVNNKDTERRCFGVFVVNFEQIL